MCPVVSESAKSAKGSQAQINANLSRRRLLQFLAASPLLASPRAVAAMEAVLEKVGENEMLVDEVHEIISNAKQAINVFDFEFVAERVLSKAHYTFLSMGVQHEVTLRANRSAFDDVKLLPRRLREVRKLDTRTEILGTKLSCPIILAPVGSQKAFHPEAELAVARAAKSRDHLQILSTATSTPLEEVVAARRDPIWFQLYTARIWLATRSQLRTAEKAGCPVLVLTVDNMSTIFGQNRDRIRRFRRPSNEACRPCHSSAGGSFASGVIKAAHAVHFDLEQRLENLMLLDWDYVDRIREATSMKLVIKGILSREDARLCVERGIDGIVVSNHGGRAIDTGLSTIEALPPIVEEVAGRIPILVDSGFRRGLDIFKALALGADAVCIGRPYVWGFSAFGKPGVEAVLDILRSELEITMKGMGTPDLASITKDYIRESPAARD